jgi:hypothetical protein
MIRKYPKSGAVQRAYGECSCSRPLPIYHAELQFSWPYSLQVRFLLMTEKVRADYIFRCCNSLKNSNANARSGIRIIRRGFIRRESDGCFCKLRGIALVRPVTLGQSPRLYGSPKAARLKACPELTEVPSPNTGLNQLATNDETLDAIIGVIT